MKAGQDLNTTMMLKGLEKLQIDFFGIWKAKVEPVLKDRMNETKLLTGRRLGRTSESETSLL